MRDILELLMELLNDEERMMETGLATAIGGAINEIDFLRKANLRYRELDEVRRYVAERIVYYKKKQNSSHFHNTVFELRQIAKRFV